MIHYLFIFFILVDLKIMGLIPGLNFFDEVLTLFALAWLLCNCPRWLKKRSPEKQIVFCILGVFLMGSASSLYYSYQPHFAGIWRDALALIKFPICYVAFYKMFDKVDKERFVQRLNTFAKVTVFVITFFGIVNIFLKIPEFSNGFRYGFPLYRFVYTHSTYLVAAIIVLLSLLISCGINRNLFFIWMALSSIILTFRSKPVLIVVFVIVSFLFRKGPQGRKLSKSKMILCMFAILFLGIYFSKSQIDAYVSYGDTAARGAYYIRGFEIAQSHFPLGSGYCTFASFLAHKYYSPLYYKYHMNRIWGMTEDDGSYAADTYWPNVYTQYGFIGFALYIMMLLGILRSINSRFELLSDKWIAAMCMWLYAICASFAESFLVNDSSAIFAVTMAVFLGNDNKGRRILS